LDQIPTHQNSPLKSGQVLMIDIRDQRNTSGLVHSQTLDHPCPSLC